MSLATRGCLTGGRPHGPSALILTVVRHGRKNVATGVIQAPFGMTGQLETTSIDLRRIIIRARTIPPDFGNVSRLPVVAMRFQERSVTDLGAMYLLGLRRSEEPIPLAKTRSHAS